MTVDEVWVHVFEMRSTTSSQRKRVRQNAALEMTTQHNQVVKCSNELVATVSWVGFLTLGISYFYVLLAWERR